MDRVRAPLEPTELVRDIARVRRVGTGMRKGASHQWIVSQHGSAHPSSFEPQYTLGTYQNRGFWNLLHYPTTIHHPQSNEINISKLMFVDLRWQHQVMFKTIWFSQILNYGMHIELLINLQTHFWYNWRNSNIMGAVCLSLPQHSILCRIHQHIFENVRNSPSPQPWMNSSRPSAMVLGYRRIENPRGA